MKKYIGKGTVGKYDSISCSICMDDLKGLAVTAGNGKQYVNFILSPMKNPDKYGKTHTIYVWQTDGENGGAKPTQPVQQDNGNDLPYFTD